MAITKLNSLAIPPDTIVESDLSYPLTNFSSTGIDDNATGERLEVNDGNVVIKANSGSNSHVFGYNEDGGEIILYDEAGATATLIDQALNSTRVLELINGSDLLLGLGGSNSTGVIKFMGAGYAERMRIDSSGNLGIGTTPGSVRLHVKGSGSGTSAYSIYVQNSAATGLFSVRNDGLLNMGVGANSPYNLTTASSANLHVNSTGNVFRSTSSARYKENIRDYDQTASIDALRPVFFNSKNEDDNKTYAGLIAEEVHEAGFTEFVEYNDAGEPDAVFYANMVALCIKEIQDLKAEVAALKGA